MPAYLIAEIEVTDPAVYEGYKKLTPDAIARYGGRFLVRGGKVDCREGSWSPERLIVVEFPTMEKARAFYESPEYAPALAIRKRAARSRLILVEGIG